MKIQGEQTDVGVLVARFQVDDLHQAHKDLIETVISRHKRVIIFLGLSPCKSTRNNPLDFKARQQMVLSHYPNVDVLYIADVGNDEIWSKNLDKQIKDLVGPTSTVTLYGGRESFIAHYKGIYNTQEMVQESYISGKERRKEIQATVKSSIDFRAGVIWAVDHQYPNVIPTVDVVIWDLDKKKILMAKKIYEEKFRFVGGFASGKKSYEESAADVVQRETHINIKNLQYIGSYPIDDWRYRRELEGITTLFFECIQDVGTPNPDGEICELKWFYIDDISEKDVVYEHKILLEALKEKVKNI